MRWFAGAWLLLPLVLFLIPACGGGEENEPASSGPSIERTQPEDGDQGVDPDVTIQVWFEASIDRNRIGDDYLYLVRDGKNVYGRISYDLNQNRLSLGLTAPLSVGEYEAVLKAGVCDLERQCLKEDFRWSFNVSDR